VPGLALGGPLTGVGLPGPGPPGPLFGMPIPVGPPLPFSAVKTGADLSTVTAFFNFFPF